MASSLDNAMISVPAAFVLSDEYKAFVESIIPSIRNDRSTTLLTIPVETGYLFRYDLTSFLLDQKVAIEDHLVIIRLNDLNGPQDFDEHTTKLMIPDQQFLGQLKQVYRTRI
ncbi:hypothetical protein D3C86_1644730 [compost metagenome]